MNREEIYSIWAPEASCWSPWVKPVLFAHLDVAAPVLPQSEWALDTTWAPAAGSRSALVLDLSGAQGVLLGLELAKQGYRPVPLYNAVPLPTGEPMLDPATGKPVAAVDVMPIVRTLKVGAETLMALNLPSDASPAFLLDADRRGGGRKMLTDEFDNRSICFTTDFPSANFLQAQGIVSALLVQRGGDQPQPDLAHILRRWQDAGISILSKDLDWPGPPAPCQIAKPSWFGMMFQRALATIGFRRGGAGGFGAWVPDSPAAG